MTDFDELGRADFDPFTYWQERGEAYTGDYGKVEFELETIRKFIAGRELTILDVGSGWGRVWKYFSERKAVRPENYTMVDWVDSMRTHCQENTGRLPDKWDGKTLPYSDGAFGMALSFDVLLHVPPLDVAQVFAEHARVAKQWLYVVTHGVVWRPLAQHCFWHDYVRLASENKLYIYEVKPFRNGLRLHYVFHKNG